MRTAPALQWLPNLLTASRLVLALPILLVGLDKNWVLCFWLVLIALATDFLDGWAAKTFHAQTRLGEYLDPVADFFLAAVGVAVIVFTGNMPLWIGLLLLVPAVYVGYVKFFLAKDTKIRIIQPMFSVPYLFLVWAGMTLFFAGKSYGWSWWYLASAVAILAVAARLKRHRLQQWYAWVLAKR